MSVPEKRRSSCDASPTSCDLCIEGKTWLFSPSPDENKELLGFVSQIGLSIRHWGCFLPARLDPLQLGDRVVQHSVYHGFVPHLVFESFRRQSGGRTLPTKLHESGASTVPPTCSQFAAFRMGA